jgi:predicted DNA-binding transcriptional regulator YafY
MQLAQELSVHRRTIFRDMAQLKSLGVPVGFDPTTSRYWLNKKVNIAGFSPTGEELCELLIMASSSWLSHDKSHRHKALRAMAKLMRILPAKEQEELQRVFHAIVPTHENVTDEMNSQNVMMVVIDSIRQKHFLHVELKESVACEIRQFDLTPQHLKHTLKSFFLDGWTDPDLRRIRLDLTVIRHALVTPRQSPDIHKFKRRTDFDLILIGE